MNLRWLWLDHVPSEMEVPQEVRLLVPSRVRKHQWDRRFRRAFCCGFGIYAAISLVWLLGCVLLWAYGQVAAGIVAFVLLQLYQWTLGDRWLRPWRMSAGRLALCQLGHSCCVKCGYVHTGLSKDVKECPECGTPREFGRCVHCDTPQDWAMEKNDKCTQCGRLRLS